MTLFCPTCNATLPLAKEGDKEQVCPICGEHVSVDANSLDNSRREVDEVNRAFVSEARRRSSEAVSRFEHRIPPQLNALIQDFRFHLGTHSFPCPTRQQVVRIAELLFPGSVESVVHMLDQYGLEQYETEQERVQLAVLKLTNGDVSQVESTVAMAKDDTKDVLISAECPHTLALVRARGLRALASVDFDVIVEAAESDLTQYLEWLDSVIASGGRS